MLGSKNGKRHLTDPGWERSGHPGHLCVPLPLRAQTESRSVVIALGYTVISFEKYGYLDSILQRS